MVEMDQKISKLGIEVIRFNFPYMIKRQEDGKRRPPDRQPKLLEAFKAQIDSLPPDSSIIIGGKSMGGRMASLIAVDEEYHGKLKAVICMGFPFHPPGKPENFRGDHLKEIKVPTLIIQGERDTFGNKEEIQSWQFSEKVQIGILPDGDHSFKPRKKSGFSLEDNLDKAIGEIDSFVKKLP